MDQEPTEISDRSNSETSRTERPAVDANRTLRSDLDTLADSKALIGKRLGNFEIVSLLGRGGFGSVYRAKDIKLGRDVAIKFLHGHLDERRKKLFEREARAVAALSKAASIVGIHEWGEIGGQNYIVLEYVEGGAGSLLREHPGGLPVSDALSIAAECAEALQAAHGAGILHRDIKPANILLEPETGQAKLADFGLARLTEDSGEFTLTGGISGSPPYMSPEQAMAAEVDGRSDIFSLGVTLYELLCGERPFTGNSSSQIMERIRRNERVPLQKRRPDFPGRICEIVEKATAHDPEQRYQGAGEFARDLRATLDSLERTGSVDTQSLRVAGTPGMNRWIGRLVAALGVIVVVWLAWNVIMEPGKRSGIEDASVAFAEAREMLDGGEPGSGSGIVPEDPGESGGE